MQVIRYARTRHLTITTRVSRFVYLLHTAPDRQTTAPPFEERAATPGDCGRGDGISPSELTHPGFNFRRSHDRVPTHHLGTHPLLGHLMPSRDLLIWAITGIWRMWTT